MEATRDLSDSDDSENDDAFDHDLDALRRACLISGADPSLLSSSAVAGDGRSISDDDDDDDLELVRNIQNRFAISSDALDSLSFKPLCTLPADCSDEANDDDFETLRAIQRRFAAYDNDGLKHSPENSLGEKELLLLENKTSDDFCIRSVDYCEEYGSTSNAFLLGDTSGEEQPGMSIEWNNGDSAEPTLSQPNCSSFTKPAKLFMDAIKKNRSFQKLLRSKLIQIEAKIEENKKLKERVKILKDFQLNCKKRTGRALSQKKDARIQLVSVRKAWPFKDLKAQDKKIPGMYCGPAENSHVENYRMALSKFPLSIDRKKWSDVEKKNLAKGIQQQFQEMVLKNMVDRMSDSGESREDVNDIDNIMISIKNLNITPENIRGFLPKVNWKQVASIFLTGRSGAECETRWLNFEDPLINRNPWTAQEDKNLLFMVMSQGISNWFDIAISLGTNRTPFHCLSRYQRSLNVSILKREWTKDDDAKLRSAVEAFGECNWQAVASSLEGWTGTQCSNRWKKSLHPAREKVGRWTEDEDKRLTVAQMLFGPRNWKKTAQFVPGRTEVQCRERWVNSLDPSLNWEKWTLEEDSKLREAIAEYGYCWAKVAAAVPRRTDNMCRRRWKKLLPHEVPLLQAARRMQKAALICNFVDRESERPAIGPYDFCPLPLLTNAENVNESTEKTKKMRGALNSCKKRRETVKSSNAKRKKRQEQSKEFNQIDSGYKGEIEAFDRQETTVNQVSEDNTLREGPRIKMVMRSTNGEVLARPDGIRKSGRGKLQSSRKQLSNADEEVGHLQSQVTSNNDGTEPLVESNITKLPRKRRAPSNSRNNGSAQTKKSTEHQSITLSSGESLLAGDPTGSNPHHEGSSCLDPMQPMGTNGKEIGALSGKARTKSEKHTGIKQCRKRKKGGDTTGSFLEAPVSVPTEANELNNVKPSDVSELDGRRKRGRPPKKKQLVKELQSVCGDSTANVDRIEPSLESNTTNLPKRRRAYSKRQNNGSTPTKRIRENKSATPSSGESLFEGDPVDGNHHHEGSSCLETNPSMGIADEEIGMLDGKAGMASNKKRGRKQYPKRRKGNEPTGILQEAHNPVLSEVSELNMVKPSGISEPAKADKETERLKSLTECVKSTSNSDRTETLDESNTSKLPKKRRASSKQQNNGATRTKKRKKQNHNVTPFSGEPLLSGDPAEANHHLEGLYCPVILQPTGVTDEEFGTIGGKSGMASKRNTGRKQYQKGKKGSEATGVLLDVLVPVPSKANELNEVKTSGVSGLDQDFGASNKDTSLTCLLRNKSESQLKINNSANIQARECIEPPARQENGLKCFDSRVSAELSFCPTGQSSVMDTINESGRPNSTGKAACGEVMKETVSAGLESSHEIIDVSPSSSDQNKLEKCQTCEIDQQARPPSCLIRGSQLLSKRINQLHDGNVTPSMTSVHDEPGGTDLQEHLVEVALEKPDTKQEEDDNELDDMTLACFMQSKSNNLLGSVKGMKWR